MSSFWALTRFLSVWVVFILIDVDCMATMHLFSNKDLFSTYSDQNHLWQIDKVYIYINQFKVKILSMTDLEFGLIYIFVQNMKILLKSYKKRREPPCKNVMHFHMKQLFVSNCVHYTFHTVFIMSVNGVGFFYICLR